MTGDDGKIKAALLPMPLLYARGRRGQLCSRRGKVAKATRPLIAVPAAREWAIQTELKGWGDRVPDQREG
jgi:hypothetical protein